VITPEIAAALDLLRLPADPTDPATCARRQAALEKVAAAIRDGLAAEVGRKMQATEADVDEAVQILLDRLNRRRSRGRASGPLDPEAAHRYLVGALRNNIRSLHRSDKRRAPLDITRGPGSDELAAAQRLAARRAALLEAIPLLLERHIPAAAAKVREDGRTNLLQSGVELVAVLVGKQTIPDLTAAELAVSGLTLDDPKKARNRVYARHTRVRKIMGAYLRRRRSVLSLSLKRDEGALAEIDQLLELLAALRSRAGRAPGHPRS